MKAKTGKIIFASIVCVVGISAIIILLLTIKTTNRSEKEVESIDEFIREIETAMEETTKEIHTTAETTTEATTTAETTTEETTTLSAEELASMVIEHGINGEYREVELGDRYVEVQNWIDKNYEAPTEAYYQPYYEEVVYEDYTPYTGGVLNPVDGVNSYYGRMETYYNLDMSGVLDIMYSLGYSGDYWIRGDGVKMFGDYVMCACDFGEYPRGSIIGTSLGTGIVCDTGAGGYGWTDIAVTW